MRRPRSSLAGTVLATLAVIASLWWGQPVVIPVIAGLILAVLITPVVDRLERLVRSRVLSTTVGIVLAVGLIAAAALAFGGQLLRVTDRVPEMISLAAERVASANPSSDSVVSRAQLALDQLDRATSRLTGLKVPRPSAPPPPAHKLDSSPIADTATVALKQTAVLGSSAVLRFLSDFTVILFVAFFILIGGQPLVDRFIDQWENQPEVRARVDHGMHECARQIRLYAGVLLLTNTLIGVLVWAVFSMTGMPDAGGWGVTAAVLHVVPYVGMAVLTCLGSAESFLAHGSWAAGLGMAGFLITISTLIGTIVTAWLQGRAAKMNSAAVFIGLVFWGGLWGLWGLFLGPALVVVLKVIAENTPAGKGLARLMQG